MDDGTGILLLFHSILRWLVLLSVGAAGIIALRSYLSKQPIIVWERSLTIMAMVLCHVQLLLGLILYAIKFRSYSPVSNKGNLSPLSDTVIRYWRYEHIGMMILAIALVTVGRILSKKATTEPGKQIRIAIFYLIALAVFLFSIPWPFTEIGQAQGKGWF